MAKTTVAKSQTRIIAKNDSNATFDHKQLPTLLQWLKKQPKDRDCNALYLVKLCFFDGGFGNHTLVTEQFRARLSCNALSYEALSSEFSLAEQCNEQVYIQVDSGNSGNFAVTIASNPAYKTTRLRWFGGDDPYTGVEFQYDEDPTP